jgi:nucleoside-diphosphate-sugar epimerase
MSSQSAKQKVLVTGAAGFVGARVVETLHLTGAAEVRAGIRQWSSPGVARLARFPVDIVICDVMNRDQIEKAMDGVTAIVHSVLGNGKVNVEGTDNLLEAAKKHGVQRFVQLSTAEVYGEPSGEIAETTPYGYTGWEYSDSKIEAEKLCFKYHAQGVPVSILRPSIVYGPFSNSWIVRFAMRLRSRQWGTFKVYGEGFCNLIYIDDLVQGIWLAVNQAGAVGEAFNLNGPEIVTWNEYFRRFNAMLHLPELPEISPLRARFKATTMNLTRSTLSYIKNQMSERLKKRLIGGTRRTAMGHVADSARSSVHKAVTLHDLTHLYNRNAKYVATKAQKVLGFRPKYDVNTGLQLSIKWLAHHGFLSEI